MTTEEVFKEVLKSPELQSIFQIPIEDLEHESYYSKSKHPVIEVIKVIINGQENHRNKDQIFQVIQNQIFQL